MIKNLDHNIVRSVINRIEFLRCSNQLNKNTIIYWENTKIGFDPNKIKNHSTTYDFLTFEVAKEIKIYKPEFWKIFDVIALDKEKADQFVQQILWEYLRANTPSFMVV